MTHLKIEQAQSYRQYQTREAVSSSVIQKLYELAYAGTLDSSSNLSGYLSVPTSYRYQVEYLTNAFSDLDISVGAYYIHFADPEVERVCIAACSSDGIGVKETDAAAVTFATAPAFKNNATITSFNELQYFTSLTTITNVDNKSYEGCTNLTSIYLPSSITTIGQQAFVNCRNLTTLGPNGLSNVTSIGNNAFRDCSSLAIDVNCPLLTSTSWTMFSGSGITKISNLGSITALYDSAFKGCTHLTEAVLPSTLTTLGKSAFYGCTSLSKINVDNITTIDGQIPFAYSKNVSNVFNYANLTSVTQTGAFCGGSTHIYAPKLTSLTGGYDKGGNNCHGTFCANGYGNSRSDKDIVYLRDVTTVQTGCFCGTNEGGIKHLIINNVTPPSVTAYSSQKQDKLIDASGTRANQSKVLNLWVPRSAISTYQADTYWGELSSVTHALEDFPTVADEEAWEASSNKADTLISAYM